jgi:hypothetical protein
MIDLLDIFNGTYEKTFVGTYYEKMPTEETNGVRFDYEYQEPKEKHYQMMFGNVQGSEAYSTAIKTKDAKEWKINSYIALQDGTFYTIVSVSKDNQSGNKEQARFLSALTDINYIVRLQEKDNPFRLR